jgi:hypothetical protein
MVIGRRRLNEYRHALQCTVQFSMVLAMKAAQLITNRFSRPATEMTTDTKVMGATVAEWTEVWTAGFRHTFQEIEERERQTQCADKLLGELPR